jgi:hypothetical protein
VRRHPPHHLSPARVNHRQGRTPKRASAAPSHHSNAPIKPESQSILSKKIAHLLSLFRPNARHGVTISEEYEILPPDNGCPSIEARLSLRGKPDVTCWQRILIPPYGGSNPAAPAKNYRGKTMIHISFAEVTNKRVTNGA